MRGARETYCIVCEKKKNGIEIEDDLVLGAIRWFKRNVTHNEKNSRLVVCKDCYPAYKSKRLRFESRQRLYTAFGILFVLMFLFISPKLSSVLAAFIILLLFLLFSLLNYTPRINIKNQHT